MSECGQLAPIGVRTSNRPYHSETLPTGLCDQLVTKIMESEQACLNVYVVGAISAKFDLYVGNSNSVYKMNKFTYSYEYNFLFILLYHVQ